MSSLDLNASTYSAPPEIDLTELPVLIVDDEPMLRVIIEEYLELLGYENQFTASDGQEALEVLRGNNITCMISDIRMPRMELTDVLKHVRHDFPILTVMATSGYNDFDSAAEIIRRGANDFLGKPLNLDSLEISLDWMVLRHRVLNHILRLHPPSQPLGDCAECLRHLGEWLLTLGSHFQSTLEHSVMAAQLLRILDTGLSHDETGLLHLALLVHELGCSNQIYEIATKSTKFQPREYKLIVDNQVNAGIMIGTHLQRPDLGEIVAYHLQWDNAERWADKSNPDLIVWAGLLNSIDGCTHDRPDREAFTLTTLHSHLTRRQSVLKNNALEKVLAQWDIVENFYSK